VKYIMITAPGRMDESIIFLVRPTTTTADILKTLKLTDFVLFPLSDPANLFSYKDELYDRVESGARLIAAVLAEAAKAYQRSKLYPQPPHNILEEPTMTTFALALRADQQRINHQPSGALTVVHPEQSRLRFVASQQFPDF
jgi:hypothetical protein